MMLTQKELDEIRDLDLRRNSRHLLAHIDALAARLAEAIECCTIKDNRNMWLEIRLKKIMARCADLLDEDQFNELDAIARADSEFLNQCPTCKVVWPDDLFWCPTCSVPFPRQSER